MHSTRLALTRATQTRFEGHRLAAGCRRASTSASRQGPRPLSEMLGEFVHEHSAQGLQLLLLQSRRPTAPGHGAQSVDAPSSSTAFQVYAVRRTMPTACAARAGVLRSRRIRPARKRHRAFASKRFATPHSTRYVPSRSFNWTPGFGARVSTDSKTIPSSALSFG